MSKKEDVEATKISTPRNATPITVNRECLTFFDDGKLSSGTRDYVCGVISGVGKIVAGHPFDTIKARVQSGRFASSTDALRQTIKKEGLRALYQGVTVPAINVCGVGGILFYFNGLIRSWVQPDPTIPLTYYQMMQAGGGGGLVLGVLINPVEVLKIHLQVHNRREEGKKEVSVRGFMKKLRAIDMCAGLTPTILREVGTFGIFFPANEFLKRELSLRVDGIDITNPNDPNFNKPKFLTRVVAAGTAGMIGWLPCYPIDQIKSRMQIRGALTYRTWLHCGAEIVKEEGIRHGMFKGLAPCLIRAFPAYAAQFLLFEQLHHNLSPYTRKRRVRPAEAEMEKK